MRRVRTWGPGLLLVSPSIVLVGIFVYGLIGVNIQTSLAQTRDRITDRVTNPGGLANYTNLLSDERYQHALWNLLVLTVVFMAGAMFFGLVWSVLLERGVEEGGGALRILVGAARRLRHHRVDHLEGEEIGRRHLEAHGRLVGAGARRGARPRGRGHPARPHVAARQEHRGRRRSER